MPLDAHQLDEDGDHDPDECELCFERNHSTENSCRCGRCCEATIIEVSLRDAEREPKIKDRCGPIRGFSDEPEGYLLNDRNNGMACTFFDRDARLCTIYETRPLVCRVFDCDSYEHKEPSSQDPG